MVPSSTVPRRRLCLATESPDPSGVGAHMLALADGLRGAFDVTLAAPPGSRLIARAASAGLNVLAIDRVGHALARRRFDIVHVHAGIGWEGHALAHAARTAGVPRVVRTEHLPYLLTDADQRMAHAAGLDCVDATICVSDAVAASHVAAGIGRHGLHIVRNGVDPVPPRRPRAAVRAEFGVDHAPVLLMVARFTAQKRHDLLIDAFGTVVAQAPDVTALLVGDGPLSSDIARLIAARGLAAHVRLLGPRRDVADLMAAADLLVLPSAFEGLPLVVLEAMAAGLAVVATAAPGTADAIDHGRTGWLTGAGDAAALADAIVAALASPAKRATAAAAARAEHAAQYGAGRMIAETSAVYDAPATDTLATGNDTMARTTLAFIGAGGIAQRHFGVLEQFDDIEIVGVCDVDAPRAAEAAARFGARAFDDVAAMLDTVTPDAVYICVPPFAHGAAEDAVIARGLPFFVEKPVALDLATAERIAGHVAAKGLITAVGYHWRYLDTVDEVRGVLARTPARLLSGYWLDATPPPEWWWHQDRSGGQMVEQTSHLLDLARYLVGEPTRAYALAGHQDRAAFPGLDVATVSTASVLFEGGAIANFASTCLLGWNHRVGLHLFGDGFAIELTDHDVMIDTGRGRPVRGAEGDPVWREDRDFIDAVQGKENRIRCPYGEAVATLRLALAVADSARSGEAVTLDAAKEPVHV